MDKNFVKLLENVVIKLTEKAKKDLSKETYEKYLINDKLWKSLLDDFAKGEYKQEIEWLLLVIKKNIHYEIYKADDLKICKLKQIRIIQEQLKWPEADAVDWVDTLAFVLRGDTTSSGISFTDDESINGVLAVEEIIPISQEDINTRDGKLVLQGNSKEVVATSSILVKPKVGSIITFGVYEWLVLEVQKDRALVLSKYILKKRTYDNEYKEITYENCSLRAYLNGEFYNSFSNADRTQILSVKNPNENNQWFGTAGGASTTDNVFLLSVAEVVKYFGDSGQLNNKPSSSSYWINDEFNLKRITSIKNATASWWLRSLGHRSIDACCVDYDGTIFLYGQHVGYIHGGVRLALRLKT